MKPCTICGDPTPRICRVCNPCIAASTDAERTAQGLPLEPTDETMERLGRLLAPRAVAS